MRPQSADDLLSVGVADSREAQALAEHLRSSRTWLEVVAGMDSVVVRFDAGSTDARAAARELEEALRADIPPVPESAEVMEVPVIYGGDHGPDLEALCENIGLSRDEFIARHANRDYRVDMVGFTPGFVFIGGLDERLSVPRRPEPRQRVAPGSIGIADGRTGIYALGSPGGWTIVGRTPIKLFDARSNDPFPIRAGMRIRFVSVSADESAT